MRILFTNTGPWGTGSATMLDGVMDELHKQGHETHVIFPDSDYVQGRPDDFHEHPDRYSVLEFPKTFNGQHFRTFPLMITDPHPRNYPDAWTYKDLTEKQLYAFMDHYADLLNETIREVQPAVIESQHIWIMSYVLKQQGYPYISVAHHSDQMGYHYDERMRPYAEEAAQGASYIFAISESVREEVIELYSVDPEKVILMPNGYDQKIFQSRRIDREKVLFDYGLEHLEDKPLITFAGKLSETKGIDFLLKANKILQEETDVAILAFGAGSLVEILEKLPEGTYDTTNFVEMGHHPPDVLAKFHNIARLSVMPSRTEGFGIAALEAMGSGLPVVASRTGGLPEFVVGELFPVGDDRTLAEKIMKILSLPEERYRDLSQKALERAREYSWKKIVDRRLDIYRSMIEENEKAFST